MSTLEDVLAASLVLHDEIDAIVESIDDVWAQSQADWVWFRLSSIGVVLRDRGGGPVAAVLARGLLEQAAYWDWAVATGVGADLVPRQAVLELERLQRLAVAIDDAVWTGWLLPPGVTLGAAGTVGMPRSAADAVKRLGSGLDGACLEPLRFAGLFAAYRLLELLTHGGIAAAHVLQPGGGEEISEPLAAAIAHVACAGATATLIAQLDPPAKTRAKLVELVTAVASAGSAVHGLALGAELRSRTPARPGPMTPARMASDIDRMPAAAASMTERGRAFVTCADHLAEVAITRLRADDEGTRVCWPAFQMAWSQLNVLRGVVNGSLAKALLPFAARPLFEEGGRWGWLGVSATHAAVPGAGLHAIVDDGRRRVIKVRDALTADGVSRDHIDHLLGPATRLLEAMPATNPLPALDVMLASAHPTAMGIDSANPMYSLLSQFVHPSPIALLHLQRDIFPSISAPMYAVAVEAACRGFHRTAMATLAICCEDDGALQAAHRSLTEALGSVVSEAMLWHFLG